MTLFLGEAAVDGCTNPQACNFNEMANADDGSCDFACWPTAVEEGYEVLWLSDSSLYLISVAEKTWQEASEAVELVGGHLVSLTSQQENSRTGAVIGMLDEDHPWIGLHQTSDAAEPAGGWLWSSGEPLDFESWAPNEPNDTNGGEDCAVLYPSSNGLWNDGICSYEEKFIVELPVHFGCTNEGSCNFDPEANAEDGSCMALDACGECGGEGVAGCNDASACNFDPAATCDDGSCDYCSCVGEVVFGANFDDVLIQYGANELFTTDEDLDLSSIEGQRILDVEGGEGYFIVITKTAP